MCGGISVNQQEGFVRQFLPTLFDEMPLGVLVWQVEDNKDPEKLRLIYVNKTADYFTNAPLSSSVGLLVQEVFSSFTGLNIHHACLQSFNTNQKIFLGELEYASHNVESGSYSLTAVPLTHLDLVAVFFENISKLKESKLALEVRENYYRNILENAVDAMVVVDHHGFIQSFNFSAEKIFGYSKKEIVGQGARVLTVGDYFLQKGEFIKSHKNAAQEEIIDYRGETVGKKKNGEEFPVYFSLREMKALNNELFYIIAIKDLSERKKIEKSLRDNEEELRVMTEILPILVCYIDNQEYYQFANSRYLHWFGLSEQDILGKKIEDIVGKNRYSIIKEKINQVLSGKIIQFNTDLTSVNKEHAYFYFNYVPRFDHNGQVIGFYVLAINVLEWKKSENARKKSEEKLRQQQTKLNQMSKLSALGEMTTSLAHEINQPLSCIAGYTQGCIERVRSNSLSSENLIGTLNKITKQIERTAEVMQRVRDFVKKMPPKREWVDVKSLIDESLVFFDVQLMNSQVQIKLEFNGELPAVFIDRVQLQQVLVNLLINAIDSVSDFDFARRKIIIKIYLERDSLIVAVRDFGKGMKSADLKQVFRPFYTTKSDGTGMGLAICHSIIEAHGGRISIDAKFKQGLSVNFSLPINQGE